MIMSHAANSDNSSNLSVLQYYITMVTIMVRMGLNFKPFEELQHMKAFVFPCAHLGSVIPCCSVILSAIHVNTINVITVNCETVDILHDFDCVTHMKSNQRKSLSENYLYQSHDFRVFIGYISCDDITKTCN